MKEGFEKAFDDMINMAFKTKLLTGHVFTHISLGLSLSGIKSDVFKVSAMLSKKLVSIDECQFCSFPQDSGILLLGKVLDSSKKPCLLAINRGQQNQILIGPNRMSYSDVFGTLKIVIPDNMLSNQVSLSQILSQNQHNLVEIFFMESSDQSFQYSEGVDLPQNLNEFSQFSLGIYDILPEISRLPQNNIRISTALTVQVNSSQQTNSQLTLQQAFQRKATDNQQNLNQASQSASQQDNGVRKTKTQIMREQKAAQLKQNNGFVPKQNQLVSQIPRIGASNMTKNQNNVQDNMSFSMIKPPSTQQQVGFQSVQPSHTNTQSNQLYKAPTQSNIPTISQAKPMLNSLNQTNPSFFQSLQTNTKQQTQNQTQQQQPLQVPQISMQSQTQPIANGQNPIQFQFSDPSNRLLSTLKPLPSNPPTQQLNKVQLQPVIQQQPQHQVQSVFQQQVQPIVQQQAQSLPIMQTQLTMPVQNSVHQQVAQPIVNNFQQNPFSIPSLAINQQHNFNSLQTSQPQTQQQQQLQIVIQKPQEFKPSQQASSLPQNHKINIQFQPLQTQITPKASNQSILTQEEKHFMEQCINYLKLHLSPSELQDLINQTKDNPRELLGLFDQIMETMGGPTNIPQNFSNSNNQYNQATIQQKPLAIKDYDNISLFILTLKPRLISNKEKYAQLVQDIHKGSLPSNQALKSLIIKSAQSMNDSFKELYRNKSNSDLILALRREEFFCHYIVISSGGLFMKKILRGTRERVIILPDWIERRGLNLYLRYLYTGKIVEKNEAKPDYEDYFQLLKIANYFQLDFLQESLIAEVIIPSMSSVYAIEILKECTSNLQSHRDLPQNTWAILKEFCMFYLAKNLPQTLRMDTSRLKVFNPELLFQIVDQSLLFLVDGNQDLESILYFCAEMWGNKDVYDLLSKSNARVDKCMAFDRQIISELSEFLKTVDVTTPYQCNLIAEPQEQPCKLMKHIQDDSFSSEPANSGNSLTIKQQTIISSNNEQEFDIKLWKPAYNYLKDSDGKKSLSNQREPEYQTCINLESQKQFIYKNGGSTIFSEAFDFGRRSWHLKIDIDSELNLSLWLVERGQVIEQPLSPSVGQNLPIHFSSLNIQFEILDPSLGDRKSFIFYSFAHDTHQIIGHKNMINLGQLSNQENLQIKLFLSEFMLHSAIMHHLANGFYPVFKREYLSQKSSRQRTGMLKLPFHTVYQLLWSNQLCVEEEDLALLYLYHYVREYKDSGPRSVQFVTNLLVEPLRYSFLSFSKALSAMRDIEQFRKSKTFVRKLRSEMEIRVSLIAPVTLQSKNLKIQKEAQRKYYNPSKVSEHARKKLENREHDRNGQMIILDEILEWAILSAHGKTYTDLLNVQLHEERNKTKELSSELQRLKTQIDMMNSKQPQTTNLQQNCQPKFQSEMPKFQSEIPKPTPVLREITDQGNRLPNPLMNAQYVPKPSFFSPKQKNSLNDSMNFGREQKQKLNNSYSSLIGLNHSMEFNEAARRGDSVNHAQLKVKNNLKTDFSLLMKEICKSPNQPVKETRQHQEPNSDCRIF